jgi:hypothetical protein
MKNALQFIIRHWLHNTRKHHTLFAARQLQVIFRAHGVHTVASSCDVCYNGFILNHRKGH